MLTLARASFACLALSCMLLCTVHAVEPVSLTLAAGACTGVPYNDIGQKFHYTTQVAITGNASCISISKLYVRDACIDKRNNEVGLNTVKQVTCTQAGDESTETCNDVFLAGSAPEDAIVNGTMATSGYYDSGDVCASESTAYVYIQSTCSNSTTVDITLTTTSYKGDLCISVAGRHIGGVGIALIVAAIAIVVVLAALLCYCCCCRW